MVNLMVLSEHDSTTLDSAIPAWLSDYYQENKEERLGVGKHWQAFIDLYNQRAQDYSEYAFIEGAPSYLFLRYFGEKIQKSLTKVDEKWIVQQMVEIQAPKAFKSIKKSVEQLVSVAEIVSKETLSARKKAKIPRAKRQSTRSDLQ
jgi:hypothetical protein